MIDFTSDTLPEDVEFEVVSRSADTAPQPEQSTEDVKNESQPGTSSNGIQTSNSNNTNGNGQTAGKSGHHFIFISFLCCKSFFFFLRPLL